MYLSETLGAIVPVHGGTATLKDALNEAIRDWVQMLILVIT